MVWCQVSIAHSHCQAAVPQEFLQYQNIAAVHHEMTGKGMAQNMRELASRKIQPCHLHRTRKAEYDGLNSRPVAVLISCNSASRWGMIGTERFFPDLVSEKLTFPSLT